MLRVLLKKQIVEVFKGYFYDAKKNKMRSKVGIAAWIIFFILIMVGLLGGMFTALSFSLCDGLVSAGMGWMYFLIMGGIAILLGAFGSVFNTYSGLYLAKDNDLLLSLPIPYRTIITARLLNVYLMGTMYVAVVFIPTLIVYWISVKTTASTVICGILMLLIVTGIVLLLSCVLGWVVAKISLRLKNKSFITVIISLLFIAAYYFFYFKANGLINDILRNATSYGEKIKGATYFLYMFGRIGEGDWLATAIYVVITAALFALVWRALSRSFLKIASASGRVSKVQYTEKAVREKSAFGALLGKEFGRFTSSANYMLNCGLGVLLIPVSGVLLLLKGREICTVLDNSLANRPGSAAILIFTMLIMLAAMIDTAAPSVSLEGKSLWIPQSLPVHLKTVLRAKMSVQILLAGIPMLFAAICGAVVLNTTIGVKLLLCCLSLVYAVFSAIFGVVIGVRMPVLTWTNEMAPIKQSGAVTIALFGGWVLCIVFAGIYMLVGYKLGAAMYLLIWIALFGFLGLILLRWLDTKGAAILASL